MKTLTTFLVLGALCLFSCKKMASTPSNRDPVVTRTYAFDNATNSSLMFQDGEAVAVFTAENRRFEIGKVLRVKAVDETTIEVSNFAPVDLMEVTIWCTIDGFAQPIKLFNIKKIRAHATQTIKYPFVEGTNKFMDVDGHVVDLSKYQTTGIPVKQVSFDFTGETELVKKLKKLSKLKWTIKMTDIDSHNDPNNNWKDDPDAKDARRFTGLMINLAYVFQDETTRRDFVNEPITNNNGVLFSMAEKEQIYERLLSIPRFDCDVCVNVAGLGGGSSFGLINYHLRLYLTSNGASSTAMHEIGHMLGFSHSSSMTYAIVGRGAVTPIMANYDRMLKNNELPITATNLYLSSDMQ